MIERSHGMKWCRLTRYWCSSRLLLAATQFLGELSRMCRLSLVHSVSLGYMKIPLTPIHFFDTQLGCWSIMWAIKNNAKENIDHLFIRTLWKWDFWRWSQEENTWRRELRGDQLDPERRVEEAQLLLTSAGKCETWFHGPLVDPVLGFSLDRSVEEGWTEVFLV